MATACLDPRLLSDYLAGRTDGPAVIAAVEDHLAQCAACQSRAAEHRPRSDSLYQALAQVATLKSASDEPELAVALSAIAGLKPAAESAPPTVAQASDGKFIRDYQLLEKLGEGGMGAVYLAMHTWLDKPVAIKLLKSERNHDPQAVPRFEREMRAVGKLEHPHIVRALDAGQDEGIHFLVMEYVSGVDLSRLVQQLGPLGVADACELIRQAALGLHHAHESELIHRDVKPSNLMLASSGQLKVLDLGLAQFRASMWESLNLTADNQVLGTLLYISPEQLAAGGQVDRRSDIYSLGVTLCELLLGAEPLRRGLAPAVVFRAPPKPARRDVPEGVWSLVQRMVAHEKAQRPGTMHEVATALANWTHGSDLPRLARRLGSSAGIPVTASAGGSNGAKRQPPQSHMPTAVTATTDVVPPPVQGPPVPPPPPPPRALVVVQRERSSPMTPRHLRLRTAGWIAVAALVLAAIPSAIWLARPRVEVSPPALQTEVVRFEASSLLAGDALDGGHVSAVDPQGKSTVLRSGENSLLPGRYTITCNCSEVVLRQSTAFEVRPGSPETVSLEVAPLWKSSNWKVPEPPDLGSLSVYEGTLWHADPAAPAGVAKRGVSYGLTLAALRDEDEDEDEDETEDGRTYLWLEVSVDNKSDPQGLQETAYVRVDLQRWKDGYPFQVEQGWIVARNRPIDQWLSEKALDARARGLVVPLDPRADSLADVAGQHGIPLFERRIKAIDALVMVFNADLNQASPWARAFRASMPPRPTYRLEKIGDMDCIHIAAHGPIERAATATNRLESLLPHGQPEVALDVWRSSQAPFSFLDLIVRSPTFEATMKLGSSVAGGANSASMPAEDELRQWWESVRKVSTARLAFDRAAFPKDGAEVRHNVTIKVAGVDHTFHATVRCAGTVPLGDDTGRWLEIEVANIGKESEHEEKARVLVNQSEYERVGQLKVERGWLATCGETFSFDPAGDLGQVSKGLRQLKTRYKDQRELPQSRIGEPVFGVHAVMCMMFNARFKAASHYEPLRAVISAEHPDRKIGHSIQLFRKNGQVIRGNTYAVNVGDLSYMMEKAANDLVPFEFLRVKLDATIPIKLAALPTNVPVSIRVEEDGVRSDATSAFPDDAAMDGRAAATHERIRKTYGKNWREWAIGRDGELVWAEYCGTLKSSGKILLRDDDQEFQEISGDELSPEDLAYAKGGRWWHHKDGRAVTFKNDIAAVRGEFVKLVPNAARRTTEGKFVRLSRSSDGVEGLGALGEKNLALDEFADEDQVVIRELEKREGAAASPAKARVGGGRIPPRISSVPGRASTSVVAPASAGRPVPTAAQRRSVIHSLGSALSRGLRKSLSDSLKAK